MDLDDDGNRLRIGPRLRFALVADLVTDELARAAGDRLSVDVARRDDPRDWIQNLARQLHLGDSYGYVDEDVHATLLVVVEGLNELMDDRALLRDPDSARGIAAEAVKHLNTREAMKMLLLGPPSWLTGQISECKVEKLGFHLQPIVQKGLTSAISGMLGRWNLWDVIGLRFEWEGAVREQAAAEARQPPRPVQPVARRPKPIPPPRPLTEEEKRVQEEARQRNRGKTLPYYEIPGDH